MRRADYLILTEASVARYIERRAELAARVDATTISAREIGNGNLNLVFICTDEAGASLVLKQSLPYVRAAGPKWPLTADRSHAEADGLIAAFRASPSTTPELYAYDRCNHVLAMEDLSHLTVWRTALDDGHISPNAASDCGRHIARLFFRTGILSLQGHEFRRAAAANTNPAMCGITEDLVFTQPFIEHENNRFCESLRPLVDTIRSDRRLLCEVARLKLEFMTRTEALIHGDLHTGSIMVSLGVARSTKAIDPEFCFYGPIAFDLGALLGNALFAAIRAECLHRDQQHRWLTTVPEAIWNAFESEFWSLWPHRIDPSINERQAAEWLNRIAGDSIKFAACEVIRRIIGFAKVSDIETLPNDLHATAATRALETAHAWLTQPQTTWFALTPTGQHLPVEGQRFLTVHETPAHIATERDQLM